jgi:topoisomerase-4 subunit A
LGLSYKSGDSFKLLARGRSNQPVIVLDSTGRSYTLSAHTLPSARGQGEPITGRINPPSGATFNGMLMGSDDQRVLLASDAGYGFVAKLSDLQSKNRAGKAVLSLPKGAHVLNPVVLDGSKGFVVAVTTEGRMLVFPIADLPEMARGKGNKMIGIPSARVAAREEYVVSAAVVGETDTLRVFSGKRYLSMKFSELEHYVGERGRRGNKLPRGFQKVDGLEINAK